MRITMVGPFGFHPNKTMRVRALGLARPLVKQGHSVRIVMPPWQAPEEANRRWEEDGVVMEYTGVGGGVVGITRSLLRAVHAGRPDVVHCFKPKAYSGLVAWWLWIWQRRRIRLIIDSDDWEGWGGWNEIASYTGLQKRFFAWQERWGMRHCHGLTVASRALESLAWAHGVSPKQVTYVPNGPGIEPGDYGVDRTVQRAELGLEDRPVIVLYSRLFEFAAERLALVLQRVREMVPDLAVLSIGTGLFEEGNRTLRGHLDACGLMDAFVDMGWLAEERLPGALAAGDVAIYLMDDTLLNRTKCPVKLADLMAVGLPVVAERVGQIPEYVRHEETGLLAEAGDVATVAAHLAALLEDAPRRRQLGAAAREHLGNRFSWPLLADIAAGVYENV